MLICERSMLDCDPPEIEDPSEAERGGVSPPELDVQVLERERVTGPGLVNTGTAWSVIDPVSQPSTRESADNLQEVDKSSPSPTRQCSSRLCLSRSPRCALIMRSPPNWNDDVDAMDGFSTILALFGDSYCSFPL